MFGKFEKKFGWLDNEDKKLLGECISYISPQGLHDFLKMSFALPLVEMLQVNP